MRYVLIGLGSAIGGIARYWFGGVAARYLGPAFPWGTLGVNMIGCGFIGFFATLTAPDGRLLVGTTARQFVMVGLCGGFTTFSSFGLETLNLAREGEWLKSASNIAGSLVFCLLGVWLGHAIAASLNR